MGIPPAPWRRASFAGSSSPAFNDGILLTMPLPTEPIGSIPRPPELIHAVKESQAGRVAQQALDELYRLALVDTIQRFEATGSPGMTDGEPAKPSFPTT